MARQVARQLVSAAHDLDHDNAVRAIVVTGQGSKAFAAGADVKELAGKTYSEVSASACIGMPAASGTLMS